LLVNLDGSLSMLLGVREVSASAFESAQSIKGHCDELMSSAHRLIVRGNQAEIVLGDGRTRVFGVHLAAIHSNVTERRRTYEIDGILRQTAAYREQFHLFLGDFNTIAMGDPFDARELPARLRALWWLGGGPIRWTAYAGMIAAGYADGYRSLHADPGSTFPTWAPRVRLDYVFIPAPLRPRLQRCEVAREAPGVKEASDHFPLVAEVEAGA
jgi:endonuclease/exonuclease/phosphatase family metal-dependent hydrolase